MNEQNPSATSVKAKPKNLVPSCMLAYMGILFFVPLCACSESSTCRFHANQGLVLFLLETIITMFFKGTPLYNVLCFACGILMLVGLFHVVSGENKPLPIIGKLKIIK